MDDESRRLNQTTKTDTRQHIEQSRRKQTLDALADLYLTDLIEQPATPRIPKVRPLRSVSVSNTESKTIKSPEPSTGSQNHLSMVDRDSGLTSTGIDRQSGDQPDQKIHITHDIQSKHLRHHQHKIKEGIQTGSKNCEGVFIGNLPGFGDAWLTQYAHHLSKLQSEPIGVVRIEDGTFHVSTVTPHQRTAAEDSFVSEEAQETTPTDVAPNRWLIRMSATPSDDELAAAIRMRQWTILCGADDAAIVAAYRLLKQLFQSQETVLKNTPKPRAIRLMIFGSDHANAEAAARKLNATVHSFLDSQIELLGAQKQVVPVGLSYDGACEPDGHDLWQQICSFMTDQNRPQSNHDNQETKLALTDIDTGQESENDPDPDDGVLASIPAQEPEPDSLESDRPLDDEPQAIVRPDVLQFLDSGSKLLQARCPDHTDIQLAVDTNCRLLVVGVATDSDRSIKGEFATLLQVRSWAVRHIELLRLASTDSQIDTSLEPAIHLLTDQVKPATACVNELGEFVTIHLMIKTQIGEQQIWVGACLN